MKVVIQRSKHASVTVENKMVNEIENGLVLLVGFSTTDTEADIDYLVKKIINLRIFDDKNGIMNKSILEVGGEILSISQFTLLADTKKGNRPSYINAMKNNEAISYYETFNQKLNQYIKTKPGIFGAEMLIHIENDGPITIVIDSQSK